MEPPTTNKREYIIRKNNNTKGIIPKKQHSNISVIFCLTDEHGSLIIFLKSLDAMNVT